MSTDETISAPPNPEATTASPDRRRGLRILFGVVLALALIALLWPRSEGRTVPGGFLVDAEGRPTPLGPQLGTVSLVHFWATWCPPCIKEIPALERLAADYADRPELRIVFVAVDDTVTQVQGFMSPGRAEGMLYDPEWAVARKFGTDQLPETHLVIGGDVLETFVGATNWDDPAIRARLDQYLTDATQ